MKIFYKEQYRAGWKLIYFHDILLGGSDSLFNVETALQIDTEDRYSIIGTITERYKTNGYYEYLLEYPERNGYNRWRQTIDIASTKPEQTKDDIEFKKIHLDFPGGSFGGLSRSTSINTIFDGSPGVGGTETDYWFSIGPTALYYQKIQFPGPPNGAIGVTKCFLWIKLFDIHASCKSSTFWHPLLSLYLFTIYSDN